MESTRIDVRFRQSGEQISVPVSSTTTIKDIIKYVCEQSIIREAIDYNDYFLVLVNNQQIMDDNQIFEEIRPRQIENPDYQMRKKTTSQQFLVDTLREFLETDPSRRITEPQILPANTESSAQSDSNENSMASILEDVVTNQPTTIAPLITSYLLQHNVAEKDEQSELLDATNLESDMNNPCPMEPLSVQRILEELKSSEAKADSNAYPISLSRAEKLAGTYQHFTTKVNEIAAETTRDPVARRHIAEKFNEMNILLCGAARVGKSTLINAICEKQVAKTSAGLGACTRKIDSYFIKNTIEIQSETVNYRYNFWDTPGIEKWTKAEIQKTLNDIQQKRKSDILCMIYCASPGSFAKLEQLDWLLEECINQHIFCALVCTNRWSGQDEQFNAVMKDFQDLLERHNPKTREEKGVTFFGNKGLCTAVNSERFVIQSANIIFEQSGIDELILGITELLDDEKLIQWLMLAFKNERFWENLHNFPNSLKTILNKLSRKK